MKIRVMATINYVLSSTSNRRLSRLQLAVVGVLTSFMVVLSNPDKMSQESSDFTFLHAQQAQFARELRKYEITIPKHVTEKGEFISHNTLHTLQSTRKIRQKRHTVNYSQHELVKNTTNLIYSKDSTSINNNYTQQHLLNDGNKLHFVVNVNNQDLHLELEPNHQLIAPGFVIERRPKGYKNLSHSHIKAYPENRCHFFGHVKGDAESKVAIATCHGLHGFIHTSQGQYLIEPIKHHNYSENGEHPHLIYNRAALPAHLDILRLQKNEASENNPGTGKICGTEESFKTSEKERKTWEKENTKIKQDDNEDIEQSTGSHSRKKRSVSRERYVEVMVVVDKEMMEFYKDEDVQTYVLTVMNMVSIMYHDSTIGNSVNVVLVNLMLMEYDETKLKITHHADNTLRSFCKWQKSINVKDDNDPNHHDVALLLTRRNICSKRNEPCSTLGLSQVNGLCQPHRSCNINEDTGLSLAFTIAHELGHNFGMQHDGPHNGCEAEEGRFQLVMAAQLNAEASPMIWSNCSKEAITKFLDRDWGYCLDDQPAEHEYYVDERPPGIKYDADHQCRLQYGEEAQYCEGIDNLCTTLWCRVENKCMTRLEAAAEGTICGDNEWCSGGRCVMQGETPLSQNGEWGEWGSWSECSRSCGAGVSYRQRHCDNPGPRNGGKYCLGERKRYSTCNTDPCPEGKPNFKDLQCSEFNNIPYKGKFYTWQYVVNPRTPCQLHCRPKGHFFSVMLSDMVKDGTSCGVKGPRSMCISGLCRGVGCDWDIGSDAKEDGCGVCRGDGSTCQTIKTEFKIEQGMGYVEAYVIPEGARNIRIEEVAEANNYLAIRNDNGEYYLNGGWFIQWNGDYEAAGTVITYKRVGDKEMLKAPGPLKEPIHIMLLFQSENPGVEFEYTIPNENATDRRIRQFKWIYLDWTHCTHSCGGGTQRSEVVCSEAELGVVDDRHCNGSTRPEDMLRVCNDHICPPRWWLGPWQHCSVSCGEHGLRRRTVLCVRGSGNGVQEALEDWECEHMKKPVAEEPCRHKPACPTEGEWQLGPWSDNCDGDPCTIQVREVYCDDTSLQCDMLKKPDTERQCHENVACGQWHADEWLLCTRTCGGGMQMRNVVCKDGQACAVDKQPISERECNTQPCTNTQDDSSYFPPQPSMSRNMEPPEKNNNKENTANIDISNEQENVKQNETNDSLISPLPSDIKTKKNERVKDLKPKMKDEFKKSNIFYSQDYQSTKSTTVTSTTVSPSSTTTSYTMTEKGLSNNIGISEGITEDGIDVVTTTKNSNYMWVALPWEECSKKCGTGTKSRMVKCFDSFTYEEDQEINCAGQIKPIGSKDCNTDPCMDWTVGKWGQCSEPCGNGTEFRNVRCPVEDICDPKKRPSENQHCYLKPCIDWVTGDWGKCSKTCNSGQQTRKVQCLDIRSQDVSDACLMNTRPSHLRRCSTEPCPSSNEARRNRLQFMCHKDILRHEVCSALKRMGRCWHNVVQFKCCITCNNLQRRTGHRKNTFTRKTAHVKT